ncbi:MAG: DUF1788 domain-containing protein [Candidatus Marsarchaeota archaeon]|nr:DUF1788 domain-containing protein [Candidatus Marsarchaeota archaeon]
MRRSIDQAFLDLRQRIANWAQGTARAGIYIFVYPPEWEAVMLARFPSFASECADAGWPIEVIDVGQGFLSEVERRKGFADQLIALEKDDEGRLRHDLGVVAERYLLKMLKSPLASPSVARLVVNTGSLATFTSYSAITNALFTDGSDSGVPVPSVLAFPGEGDERSLNLLRLRADTNYRVPRI